MKTIVQKCGSSLGISIRKKVAEKFNMLEGTKVTIDHDNNGIHIKVIDKVNELNSENLRLEDRTEDELKLIYCGVNYAINQLNFYMNYDSKNNLVKIDQHFENALLESTLYHIRKLYEFFFYLENQCKNDYIELVRRLKYDNQTKDDAVAEYFFEDIKKWEQIKKENNITNRFIISKEKLNKHAMHWTFRGIETWEELPEVINKLNRIYKVFKENQEKIEQGFDFKVCDKLAENSIRMNKKESQK